MMADTNGETLMLEDVAVYLKARKRTVYRPDQKGRLLAGEA